MKRCESRWTFRVCGEASSEQSRRRRHRSILPISAVAAAGVLPHSPGARGGGRSRCLHKSCERGPTQRETLQHLFGITDTAASHEKRIRRMPPFKIASVADGGALLLSVGVIRKVVTSSSTLNSSPLQHSIRLSSSPLRSSITPPTGDRSGPAEPSTPSRTRGAARSP